MKRFKFSLDVLLKVKNAEEKKLDHEIHNVNQRLLHFRQELEKIEKMQKNRDTYMKSALEEGIHISSLKDYGEYRHNLSEMRKSHIRNIEETNVEAEKFKKEYIALKKELDVLEDLKRQQFNLYRYNIAQKQANEMEDIISYKASRGVQDGNA